MLQRTFLADLQSQVIQTGVLIIHVHTADCFLQSRCAVEQHRTEIKIVTQSAELIINHRSVRTDSAGLIEVIGINHRRTGIFHQCFHSL